MDAVARHRHAMRFDGRRYRNCRWCYGEGCLYCEAEAKKAYQREFPDGPKPLATFTADELEQPAVRGAIGAEAVQKAFSPGGRGMAEIAENLRKIGKLNET